MKRKITAVLMTLALLFGMTFTVYANSQADYTTVAFFDGSGTWTVPDGVTFIIIEVIGGGGGAAAPVKNNTGSGGGGGGGFSADAFSVTPGQEFHYSIGTGGSADGGNGGDTVFGTLTAGGGKGAVGTSGGAGGSGIVPPDEEGNERSGNGGSGADAVCNNRFGGGSGGGGGAALGTNAKGIHGGFNEISIGGTGGVKNAGESGTDGTGFGAGAGGSFRKSNVFGNSGQTGSPGVLLIHYIITA